MLDYSPYDRLPPAGGRPALLVTGAVNDSRVLVHEPAKWVAALRRSDPEWGSRCLFRCELGAGSHSGPQSADGRIGYEAELDGTRFYRTPKGITLVTQKMLDALA